mgnify:CR=1 FL=1
MKKNNKLKLIRNRIINFLIPLRYGIKYVRVSDNNYYVKFCYFRFIPIWYTLRDDDYKKILYNFVEAKQLVEKLTSFKLLILHIYREIDKKF